MTESEADSKGYTNEWFKAAESRLDADDSRLYLLDEEGQCVAEIEKPQEIKAPVRWELSEGADMAVKVLCVVLFLCIMCTIGYAVFRKR